jgi:chromosome segregation ATPase
MQDINELFERSINPTLDDIISRAENEVMGIKSEEETQRDDEVKNIKEQIKQKTTELNRCKNIKIKNPSKFMAQNKKMSERRKRLRMELQNLQFSLEDIEVEKKGKNADVAKFTKDVPIL